MPFGRVLVKPGIQVPCGSPGRERRKRKVRGRYQDRYAEVRRIHARNRSVCYWRNNLSVNDFQHRKGEGYVFEDTGSYCGLTVWMRIMVKEDGFRPLLHGDWNEPVMLRGSVRHLGIRLRMKTDIFPREIRGAARYMEYAFRMEGTLKGLSFRDEEAERRVDEYALSQREWKRQKVPGHLATAVRFPFSGGCFCPR